MIYGQVPHSSDRKRREASGHYDSSRYWAYTVTNQGCNIAWWFAPVSYPTNPTSPIRRLVLYINGWWFEPSEKYESQLGWWNSLYMENNVHHQPAIYIYALICIHYWAQSCSAGLVRPRYVHGITQGPQGPMWATWPLATMDTHSHVQRAIKIPWSTD